MYLNISASRCQAQILPVVCQGQERVSNMINSGVLFDALKDLSRVDGHIDLLKGFINGLAPDEENRREISEILEWISKAVFQASSKVHEVANTPKKTSSIEEALGVIEYADPWTLRKYFEEYPIKQIREAVIDKMVFDSNDDCKWAEDWIRKLEQIGEKELCAKLYEGYVSSYNRGGDDDCIARALRYALDSLNEPGFLAISENLSLKLANGALKCNGDFWWSIPSMREAILIMLHRIKSESYKKEYSETDWLQVERAVERIIQMGDITYLSEIRGLLEALGKGLMFPTGRLGFAARERHIAFLRSAVEHLKKEEKEQWPSLDGLISKLNDQLDCSKHNHFSVKIYPSNGRLERSSDWGHIIARSEELFTVVVKITSVFEEGKISDKDIKDVFSRLTFGARAVGVKGNVANPLLPDKNPPECAWPLNSVFEINKNPDNKFTAHAGLIVTPTKGHNRLKVSINLDNESIFQGMIYIIGEEKKSGS